MTRSILKHFVLLSLSLFAVAAVAQGTIHGNGDPRRLTPTPTCAFSRFFVDDTTGTMYQANQGSPCVWSPAAGLPAVPAQSFGSGPFNLNATGPLTSSVYTQPYWEVEANGTCEFLSSDGTSWSYFTATDDACQVPSAGTPVASLNGQSYQWGMVVNSGGTYYLMAIKNRAVGGTNSVDLLSASSLAGPYTLLHAGIFTAGTSGQYNYSIENVTFQIVGSTWFFLWEGGTSATPGGNFGYSYATSCQSGCNLNTNATVSSPLFAGSHFGLASLLYDSTYNALMLFYDDQTTSNTNAVGSEQAYVASAATPSALTSSGAWTSAPGMMVWLPYASGIDLSDPHIAFAPAGTHSWNSAMFADDNAGHVYMAPGPYTLDQLYLYITNPPGVTTANPKFAKQTGSGAVVMDGSLGSYPTVMQPTFACSGSGNWKTFTYLSDANLNLFSSRLGHCKPKLKSSTSSASAGLAIGNSEQIHLQEIPSGSATLPTVSRAPTSTQTELLKSIRLGRSRSA